MAHCDRCNRKINIKKDRARKYFFWPSQEPLLWGVKAVFRNYLISASLMQRDMINM